MLSEMQPPPTQALKGYVELLAVAELHSTTTFIVMIIAHNLAIVKHFPKYIVASGKKQGKTRKPIKKEKHEAIGSRCNIMITQRRQKINPYFQKFFHTVESHGISRPAIRKQVSKVLQTLDIFQLPNCIFR